MKRCRSLHFHCGLIVTYIDAPVGMTHLVSLAQRKNMSCFKAREIVAKDPSPCKATSTVAISDARREIS